MYRKPKNYLVLFAVVALVSLTVGIVSAAPVTQSITYQGKLTNAAGSPLTGTYSVTFKIYDASTGGTTLSTDTHSVTAANGLFTTPITVTSLAVIDGRALWLGIKVGSDAEMTPRQEIRPVPYAMSLRPGAVISGNNPGGSIVHVLNTADGSAALMADTTGAGSISVYGAAQGPLGNGVYGESTEDAGVFGIGREGGFFTTNSAGTSWNDVRPGVNVSTSYNYNPGVRINTGGLHSDGVETDTTGSGSYGVSAYTTGDNSDGVRSLTTGPGSHGFKAVTYGKASNGVDTVTIGDNSKGVNVTTYGQYSPGVSSSTTGTWSVGMGASTSGGSSIGMSSSTTGDASHGVVSFTSGAGSHGLYGSTSGESSDGVVGWTTGANSRAVYGESVQDVGVFGKGKTGGYFATNQAGTGSDDESYGVNISTSKEWSTGMILSTDGYNSEGVFAKTDGPYSVGIDVSTSNVMSQGVVAATGGDYSQGVFAGTNGLESEGVWAQTLGDNSDGVSSHTWGTNSRGVYAVSQYSEGVIGSGVNAAGVKGESTNKAGVWGVSTNDVGLYAVTNRADDKYGIYTPDYLYAKGTQVPAADVAEYMPVAEDVTPGTVLVIGAEGKLQPSESANDTRVIGIVSTDPGVTLGTRENGNHGEAQIAVAGRVPCRVDATYGAIRPGDLLTTSPTPGHAMKAQPVDAGGVEIYRPGTVLGKALGTLESGTGTIEVVVTLQ